MDECPRKHPEPEWVVTSTHDVRLPKGTLARIVIRIGTPYDAKGEWRCPIALEGLDGRFADIAGEDALQALALAVRFVNLRLNDWVEKGLTFSDGETEIRDSDAVRWVDAMFGIR